jgi:hypothetical protein
VEQLSNNNGDGLQRVSHNYKRKFIRSGE